MTPDRDIGEFCETVFRGDSHIQLMEKRISIQKENQTVVD